MGHQLPEGLPHPTLSIGLGMSHTQTKKILQQRAVVLKGHRGTLAGLFWDTTQSHSPKLPPLHQADI